MSTLMSTNMKSAKDEQDQLTIKPERSNYLAWLVSDENDDPIQIWNGAEETIRAHCNKLGWTYYGVPFFVCTKQVKP